MSNEKDIKLDEKTKKMVASLLSQIKKIEHELDIILQTVVNTKYPNSEDKYELSEDLETLKIIN